MRGKAPEKLVHETEQVRQTGSGEGSGTVRIQLALLIPGKADKGKKVLVALPVCFIWF